jgi:major vault protein
MIITLFFKLDIIQIETADHARLSLKVSYNWHFDVNKSDPKDATKLFNVNFCNFIIY